MAYVYTLVAMIAIYSILTLSTNLLIGYGGIVSMGQASVFGVGAYCALQLPVGTDKIQATQDAYQGISH